MKKHLIEERVKLIEKVYLSELEKEINDFKRFREVKNINIIPGTICQKGYPICDRIGNKADYIQFYIGMITYMHDVTKELVDNKIFEWLSEKLKNIGPNRPMGLSHEENAQKEANRLVETDEYKNLCARYEDEFSVEEE